MEIALPLLALASLIVAAVFAVRAKTVSERLAETKPKLIEVENELKELQRSLQQRSQKEKNRGSELEELREKQKELRRQLHEAEEQARKLKDQEGMRREAESEAREQAAHSRAEAQEASHQMRVLRAELDLVKSRRPVRPAVVADPAKSAVTVAPVPVPSPATAPALSAELADLESQLRETQARSAELDAKAKGADRKAHEAAREQERLKAKISTADKLYIVQRGELELWKDRYRTLEQRLNKTLREVDALHRGVLALERRLPQAKVEEARAEAQAQAERAAAERAAVEAARSHPADVPGSPTGPDQPAASDRRGSQGSEEWAGKAAAEPSLPEPIPDASAKTEGDPAEPSAGRPDSGEATASGIPPASSEAVPEV